MDENDLLYSNNFIIDPELNEGISSEKNNEFKKYYEKSIHDIERMRENSIRSVFLSDNTDSQSILNTNEFKINQGQNNQNNQGKSGSERRTKDIITYISVDSRHRNKILYTKPSNFSIFLGRTFYNVKSIKLASIEFPNTNAVVNSNNNNIYWTNQEDITLNKIDAITNTYPEYNVKLRIGSYISSSIQTEMTSKLSTIKRLDNVGDYHYFIVSLDNDTDVVTFTSLILTQLPNNPLQTSVNTSIIEVTLQNHGYFDGEEIYLQGVSTLAGISSTILNAIHKITVIDINTFRFEINVKAGSTVLGGGNLCKSGRIAPFKFLFGEKSSTIAPNIGYPLENSSELIMVYIKSITNLYQLTITVSTPHQLTNSDLGTISSIFGSGTTPSIDGNNRITQIINNTSFNVSISASLLLESLNSGQVILRTGTFNITSIYNTLSNTILVSTFTPHNYTVSDIGSHITLYNTTTTPNMDGSTTIFNVFDTKSFVIPGTLPSGGFSPPLSSSGLPGADGYISKNKPLATYSPVLTGIIQGNTTTTFTCPDHRLNVGDSISFSNLVSYPDLTKLVSTVFAIPNNDTFILNLPLKSFDSTNINNGTASVMSGLMTVSFPGHNFNKIISIQNTTGFETGLTYGNLLLIQTQLPHNYTNSQLVRVSQTNSTPTIDGGYPINIVSNDTFTIPYSFPITTPGDHGITSFNQDFYLYGSTTIGGINPNNINGNLFTIRDILDQDTFTFYNNKDRASSTEIGGGGSVYISSLLHGFSGQQTNTKNNLLNRSINLQGENYSFLCCPQLSTMMNTGNVKNVFARISLDQSPGTVVFSYLSNPKTFDLTPLSQLNDLDFSILNHDGTEYEFNDLDYSFTLQITETIDITDNFQLNSKRGIVDN